MVAPRIFSLKGHSFSADELIQNAIASYTQTADLALNQIMDALEEEISSLLDEMRSNTSEPRMTSVARRRTARAFRPHESAFKNVFVRREDVRNREIRFGPSHGRFIASATILIDEIGGMALKNAFSAMDTGTPTRFAHGKHYMRFPRYEGNIMNRSGDVSPIRKVVTGDARSGAQRNSAGRVIDNWVTVAVVQPSAPFNLLARLRTRMRKRLRDIRRLNPTAGSVLDSSKIRISISHILDGE